MTEDQQNWVRSVLDFLNRESGTYENRLCDCETCQEALSKWERGLELFSDIIQMKGEEQCPTSRM